MVQHNLNLMELLDNVVEMIVLLSPKYKLQSEEISLSQVERAVLRTIIVCQTLPFL